MQPDSSARFRLERLAQQMHRMCCQLQQAQFDILKHEIPLGKLEPQGVPSAESFADFVWKNGSAEMEYRIEYPLLLKSDRVAVVAELHDVNSVTIRRIRVSETGAKTEPHTLRKGLFPDEVPSVKECVEWFGRDPRYVYDQLQTM